MNIEVEQAIRKGYLEKKANQQQVEELIGELDLLEQTTIVSRYKKLKEALDSIAFEYAVGETDERMIYTIYRNQEINEEDTNKIYFYLGAYKKNHEFGTDQPSTFRVSKEDPTAEYSVYKNIESNDEKIIPMASCEEFEENNKIIYGKQKFPYIEFLAVQDKFLTTMVKEGQSVACQKILKRSK